MDEKTKKKLEEADQSGSTEAVIDPPSPIRRHVKWKMARTKKTGQMTSEATKEIAKKIDSLEEQVSQGSFVPYGRQDLLTVAIGQPEHPDRVRTAGIVVSPAKPIGRSDPEVMWDASLFGLFNLDFPLYIKHEDLSKIHMVASDCDKYASGELGCVWIPRAAVHSEIWAIAI
ncbi:hypothetical protein GmHk_20G057707 [Glycine max]|nr:hypothetical protein GmHk_20G057707 [Glycine max]KAH1190053.1 hypothetical protein GmHk_20G057707 [Glycine max]